MADNIKPWNNYFSSDELLTAHKLNKAFDTLSSVDDQLKSLIDNKADQQYVTDAIATASNNYLHLESDTNQTVNSDLTLSKTNILGRSVFTNESTFVQGNLIFDSTNITDGNPDVVNALLRGSWDDYLNAAKKERVGSTFDRFLLAGYMFKEGVLFTPFLAGSWNATTDWDTMNPTLSVLGNVVLAAPHIDDIPGAVYERELKSYNKYLTQKEVREEIRQSRVNVYDPTTTYNKGDIITTPSNIYVSKQDNNLGYYPDDNPAWWDKYLTNLDNYYSKSYIDANYAPISTLSKYSGGGYVNLKSHNKIYPGQIITLPFRYYVGKANLIVTVGGVIQTLNYDYLEVKDTVDADGTSNQVEMLTPYDLNNTGALEFRTLPYGKIVDNLTINDTAPSKITTYSSNKLESWHSELIRYANANTAMSASNWTFVRQEIFNDESKRFSSKSKWQDFAVLNLTLHDIWPKPGEVIDVKPYRLIQVYASGTYFEGFLNDANQDQVILTSSTERFIKWRLIFDKKKEQFFVDSDLDITVSQVLIFQARVLSKFNVDAFGAVILIDDSATVLDKSWSSQKTKTELDNLVTLINNKADITEQTRKDLQKQVNDLKTFITTTVDATNASLLSEISQVQTDLTTKVNGLSNRLDTFSVDATGSLKGFSDVITDVDNLKKAASDYVSLANDQTITGEKTFDKLVKLTTAEITTDPVAINSVVNKKYVDDINNNLTNSYSTLNANINVVESKVDNVKTDLDTLDKKVDNLKPVSVITVNFTGDDILFASASRVHDTIPDYERAYGKLWELLEKPHEAVRDRSFASQDKEAALLALNAAKAKYEAAKQKYESYIKSIDYLYWHGEGWKNAALDAKRGPSMQAAVNKQAANYKDAMDAANNEMNAKQAEYDAAVAKEDEAQKAYETALGVSEAAIANGDMSFTEKPIDPSFIAIQVKETAFKDIGDLQNLVNKNLHCNLKWNVDSNDIPMVSNITFSVLDLPAAAITKIHYKHVVLLKFWTIGDVFNKAIKKREFTGTFELTFYNIGA